ncbi:MAG: T9SS type A sorting domain-containing protein, partial [Segetibacter sp.]
DKRKIASVGGMQWTNPREWTKYESQRSVTIFLQANTKYYIEVLNKEGAGGDNLAVGWVIPGSTDIMVIPGSVLSPFTGTSSQSLNVNIPNPAIRSNLLRKVADDVNNDHLSLLALPNPTSTHFTINIKSSKSEPVDLKVWDAVGRLIETKRKVSANGSVTIGDRYHTGIYYLQAVQGSERATLKLIKGGF